MNTSMFQRENQNKKAGVLFLNVADLLKKPSLHYQINKTLTVITGDKRFQCE